MIRRLVLMAIFSTPLCGCYGLWDTNQTLIQFVTGTKIEVVKAPTYAEDRDAPRRRKVIVKTKAEAEAEKLAKKGGKGEDSEVAMLKAAQERSDKKGNAPAEEQKPAEQKPVEQKPAEKPAEKAPEKPAEQTLSADKKPADAAPAKPHYPEQKAPPAVPRPAVKIDASADAPAGASKPMIPLPSPAKSIPQGATPAERSWQAKTAKRDKKATQQQEQKQEKPADAKPDEAKPAEPAQGTNADAPKPS